VTPPAPALRRSLGVVRVSLTGIGVILGAGVYALIGPAAAHAGAGMWMAFVLAGITAGLTAYSYARFAKLRPKASPEFQYTGLAFGPVVGFVAGWLMLLADLLAAATVALGFGGYFAHLVGTPVALNALGLLFVMALLVAAGVDSSVGLAVALTIVEVAGLLFVVAVGVPSWAGADLLDVPHGLGGVWSAAALIFFAYIGFDELGNFAEEMRRPERDLPRALFVAMTVTTIIYVLVAVSAVASVGAAALAGSGAPLALVARAALGPRADAVFSVVALCATANTVLLLVASGARSIYGMAEAGVLPRPLARIHRATAVPVVAIAVVLAVIAAFVFLGDLAYVASLTDAAVLTSFAMVNLALVWLVLRAKVPRRAIDLVVPALAALLCAALITRTGWPGLLMTAGFAVAGVALTLSLRRAARR
jgi:APA family basic amino acid/polyamine antiporter